MEALTGVILGLAIAGVILGGTAGLLWLLAGSRAEKTINRGFDRFWDALERKSKKAAEENGAA